MSNETNRAIISPTAAVLLFCTGLVSCGGASEARNAVPAAAGEGAPPIVTAVKVERENLSNALVLTAEFIPYQEIDVMAKVAGYIKTIRVDIGDRVREGDPIATLEVPEMQDELNKAGSSIQAAEAEIPMPTTSLLAPNPPIRWRIFPDPESRMFRKKKPAWCPSRTWTRRIPAISRRKRRSPARKSQIEEAEQRGRCRTRRAITPEDHVQIHVDYGAL